MNCSFCLILWHAEQGSELPEYPVEGCQKIDTNNSELLNYRLSQIVLSLYHGLRSINGDQPR